MKKIIIIVFLCLLTGITIAQNPTWALPRNTSGSGYYDVSNQIYEPFPTSDPLNGAVYSGILTSNPNEDGYNPTYIQHKGAANAISKPTGELLFFIVGNNIFDGDGRTIYSDFYAINNMGSGFSEIAVIPNPANCNQYYLVTERVATGVPVGGEPVLAASYAILDVTVTGNAPGMENFNPNAKGGIITPFQDLISLTPHTLSAYFGKASDISMAVTPLNSNNERFLFLIHWIQTGIIGFSEEQVLLKFKISNSGIQYMGMDNIISDIELATPVYGRQELEVCSVGGNYRLATGNITNLAVFDLDGTTLNLLPGSIHLPAIGLGGFFSENGYVRGIEFNATGDLVYFTHQPTPSVLPNVLNCYNINTMSFVNIPGASSINNEFQYSYIEMGIDGNLYLPIANSLAQLSGINNPSTAVFNSSYQVINYLYNDWDYSISSSLTKRYTLPDQIDGMDYAAHFDDSPECCVSGLVYGAESYTASLSFPGGANQIWTPSQNPLNGGTGAQAYITGVLKIPSGINVTIQGMTLYFHPDAKVVVERSANPALPDGAKLTLTNSTLTVDNRCGNSLMWQGVEVQGHSSQPQVPISNSKQGYLQMNNSTIEHAMVGAQAYGTASNNRGGIIRTSNSTFHNNRIDVRIYNYSAVLDNQCLFSNTIFKTDGLHNDPINGPLYHAFLYQSGGIKFIGCDFINETPDLYLESQRGIGIFNIRNKLTVVPGCASFSLPCAIPDPNTFENLRYGVYATGSLSPIGLEIDGNDFINNFYGVYVGGLIGSKILRNDFEVLRSASTNILTNQTTGVYLNSCTGYKVEENSFRDFNDPLISSGNTRGVVVHNSGELHNEVYKNYFQNILVGGQSQLVNSPDHFPGTTPPTNAVVGGFQWLCNDFDDATEVDLYISSGRIDYQQGYDIDPLTYPLIAPFAGARNLFSPNGSFDFAGASGVQSFTYTHYLNNETEPIIYTATALSDLDEIPITINYNTSCPTKIIDVGIGKPVKEITEKASSLKVEITDKKGLIDGGNTTDLIAQIQTGAPGTTKNMLLSKSPYLSDAVLIAYLNKNPPAGNVKQVLEANSPLSAEVLALFNSKNYPNGIKNQINAIQNGTSQMVYLNNTINYLVGQREYEIDEAIRYYLYDTIVVSPMDSIIQILKDEDRQIRQEQLCDAYIIKADLANAVLVRNDIIVSYGASNYTDLASINIATRLEDDPIAAANSDSAMVTIIEHIATDPTDPRICPRGEGMLYEFIYSQNYIHEIEDLYLPGQGPKSMIVDQNQNALNIPPSISVYPNPTSEHLFVEFIGYESTSNFEIEFFNLLGQKILSVPMAEGQSVIKIDVSIVPSGVYFVNVSDREKSISVIKVVVE